MNQNRAIFLATAVLTVFLAMIASYAIVRYVIVKPLKHLRDVSEEISRGNMEARAEIHTADEFEEVGHGLQQNGAAPGKHARRIEGNQYGPG